MSITSAAYVPKYVSTSFHGTTLPSFLDENGRIKNGTFSNEIANTQKKLDNLPKGEFNKDESDEMKAARLALKNNPSKVDLEAMRKEELERIGDKEELANTYTDGSINDYWQFDNIIDDMHLSRDKANEIRNSVLTAVRSEFAGRNDSEYSMTVAQTNFELKYVSQNLVPKDYQDKFNSTIDKYTNESLEKRDDVQRQLALSLMATKNPNTGECDWKKQGQELLDQINSGKHISQITAKIYRGLYDNIQNSDPSNVKENLESVYNDLIQNGPAYDNGASTSQGISNYVVDLKEKWNSLMYVMGNNNLMFKTSIDALA